MRNTMAAAETRAIPIPTALYERFSAIAAREGRGVEELAEELLAETLSRRFNESAPPHAGMTFE